MAIQISRYRPMFLKIKVILLRNLRNDILQMGIKLKCLRTNNGLQLVSKQFNKFCRKLVLAYQNNFGGEVVTTVVYLINRCPSSTIGFKTAMELWNIKFSDYSNLKVFGSLAFAHVKEDKLGVHAIRYAFIGYPHGI
ncbi:hypothetical protein CR513_10585, partial [Mucuna pruriens]